MRRVGQHAALAALLILGPARGWLPAGPLATQPLARTALGSWSSTPLNLVVLGGGQPAEQLVAARLLARRAGSCGALWFDAGLGEVTGPPGGAPVNLLGSSALKQGFGDAAGDGDGGGEMHHTLRLAAAVSKHLRAMASQAGSPGDVRPGGPAAACAEAVVVVRCAERLSGEGLAAVLRSLHEAEPGGASGGGSGGASGGWSVAQVLGVEVPMPPATTFVLLLDGGASSLSSSLAAQHALRAALPEPLR